jgi:hypothetical protein
VVNESIYIAEDKLFDSEVIRKSLVTKWHLDGNTAMTLIMEEPYRYYWDAIFYLDPKDSDRKLQKNSS